MVMPEEGQPLGHDVLALSAALLICAILSNPSWKFLEARFISRLGDISYSIYILHFPIMCTIATLLALHTRFSPNTSAIVLAVTTVLTTWIASEFVYRFVELPGIRAGKVFSQAVFSRWPAQAQAADKI